MHCNFVGGPLDGALHPPWRPVTLKFWKEEDMIRLLDDAEAAAWAERNSTTQYLGTQPIRFAFRPHRPSDQLP